MTEIPDILRRIVERRRARVREHLAASDVSPIGSTSLGTGQAVERSFVESLRSARGHSIIAEVKMGSPRLGSLHGRLDPFSQARLYADHGAAALSVVVEPDFFHGSYELLTECRRVSGLPAIAKDFVVDPVQLEWAERAGADAVLLIAALHTKESLIDLASRARGLGLASLIECHSEEDVAKLEGGSWDLVGINNRDLRTFEVDLDHSESMLSRLPDEALKVAESGIRTGAQVARLAAAGFHAFLVGESLLLAEDVGATLRDLVGQELRS